MLTAEVREGVLRLSLGDREELAAVLVESLRDEAPEIEVEIDLDATVHMAEADDDEPSAPRQL